MICDKNKYVFILLYAAWSIFFSKAYAAPLNEENPVIKLNGPWKFKTGDSIQWSAPDFDDSEWETVDLTAPVGAHDGDVGLTGYVTGWAGRGYPAYSGYAWYRMKVSLDGIKGNVLALLGPPAVDEAYQLFMDGKLIGEAGDFSGSMPVAYSIQPRMFILSPEMRAQKEINIAFRVWMSSSALGQSSESGGIHIAPELGERNKIELRYRHQWGQTIKGYIVDVIEPVLFILLALIIFILYPPARQHKWLIIALVLLALVRGNQAFYYWLQIETSHGIDVVTTVILMPLVLGSWLLAWREWYKLNQMNWIFPVVMILVLLYMGSQLLSLPWLSDSASAFQAASKWIRLFFVLLLLFMICQGLRNRHENGRGWLTLVAAVLVSVGLFAQELSALHIQGIWFPYGVGVSRTQYAYSVFIVVLFILLFSGRKQNTLTS
ncbi:glycoside hydrolase [Chryseobacterium sp. G0240]|uniref:glycoside hydrolase n=1 Tax=Chryseobacterium sp. G0240 TaxID=2487066 RepID=UPI000F44CE9A|nr:glycoside hydrolase [Chryseobacterium sp. G0240]ROI04804.1 glycoside hydrolase [Chryseobacterium sp. G0240]